MDKILQERRQLWMKIHLIISIVLGVLAIVLLLLIDTDPKNSTVGGYSLRRLALLCIMLVGVISFMWIYHKIRTSNQFNANLQRLILSLPIAILFFLLLFLSGFLFFGSFITQDVVLRAYGERLSPLLLWGFLIAFQGVWYQYRFGKNEIVLGWENWKKKVEPIFRFVFKKLEIIEGLFENNYVNILFTLIICGPIVLQNAVRFSQPVGYAGLYALMAEKIAGNGFHMPMIMPYYGPGGIPFAYPPLSFYVMAFITGIIKVAPLDYMRIFPPIFLLLCLIPVNLLGRGLTRSKLGAIVAPVLLAASARFYMAHGQAAGLARTLALFFALSGICAFYYAMRGSSGYRYLFLAGIFFGLALLTHPSSAEFCAVSIAVLAFTGVGLGSKPFKHRFISGMVVAFMGLVISAPWWGWALNHYGYEIFKNVSGSYDTLGFAEYFRDLSKLHPVISEAFYKLNKTPLLSGPAILGLVFLVAGLRLELPLLFFVHLIIWQSYDMYLIIISSLLSAVVYIEMSRRLANSLRESAFSWGIKWGQVAMIVFVGALLGANYSKGYQEIKSYEPLISEEMIELGEWFQNNTDSGSQYLRISSSPEEAEWYPYLLRREPSVGSWGAEWLGEFKAQRKALDKVVSCSNNQSIDCIEEAIVEYQLHPDYLITEVYQVQLTEGLQEDHHWSLLHEQFPYNVWLRESELE